MAIPEAEAALREERVRVHRAELLDIFDEQRVEAVSALELGLQVDRAEVLLHPQKWEPRLSEVLFLTNFTTAQEFGRLRMELLTGAGAFVIGEGTRSFLASNALWGAQNMQASLRQRLQVALDGEDVVDLARAVFAEQVGRVGSYAHSTVNTAMNNGTLEAAFAAGRRFKVWEVNSKAPRTTHASMDGERVELGARFSNGQDYPGDPRVGKASEIANCRCSMGFTT